ncbi:MAG: HEAT repeat domain-containing protein [Acidobacteriota bacterium]
MAREANFDLAAELAKPSFTPAQRDVPALVELAIGGHERAAAALGKLGDVARAAVAARLAAVDDAARAVLVGVLGKLGDEAAVIARLADAAPRVRRAAASALGKLGGERAREALVARWDASDVTPDERRALVEALGKLGGDDVLARLRTLDPGGDAELARRRDRALLMIDRDARRDASSSIAIDVPPPAPVIVRLHCKAGLAPLLAEELPAASPRGDDAVELTLAAPWASLHASRLWTTAGIRIALPAGELPAAIVDALASPAEAGTDETDSGRPRPGSVRALLAAWTRGPIRWRLGFAHGHRRAVVWQVAREVAARAPELINDPTETTWDVLVDEPGRALELVPRRADDPRFSWRVAEVPAASHPTVAAALARVGGARPGDRVWDPFVGSGAELVERARLGPYRSLHGSDLDDAALAAARANLDAAGLAADLARADARTHAPGPVDLILTNPPLGSRVRVDAGALLAAALPHFARQLAPGGRLVWITPAAKQTGRAAERAGLRCTRALPVDLGGVHGTLERWEK